MSDSLGPHGFIAHQAPLSKGFSSQEYWSKLPCPPLADLPDPGIESASLKSPALAAGPVPLAPLGKPRYIFTTNLCGSESQAWFKDEDTEVLKLSNVIKAPQSFEAEQE